jgi:hypothetical protein
MPRNPPGHPGLGRPEPPLGSASLRCEALPSASPFTQGAVAQLLTADPHLACCLSEAFSTRASDLEPPKDLRLPNSTIASRCLQSLAPGLAPRSAPPHSDLVPGLSALTSGSLSSSRRSPRDSGTSQPPRRVNPDLAWGSQPEDCLHRPGPELVGSDRSRELPEGVSSGPSWTVWRRSPFFHGLCPVRPSC